MCKGHPTARGPSSKVPFGGASLFNKSGYAYESKRKFEGFQLFNGQRAKHTDLRRRPSSKVLQRSTFEEDRGRSPVHGQRPRQGTTDGAQTHAPKIALGRTRTGKPEALVPKTKMFTNFITRAVIPLHWIIQRKAVDCQVSRACTGPSGDPFEKVLCSEGPSPKVRLWRTFFKGPCGRPCGRRPRH